MSREVQSKSTDKKIIDFPMYKFCFYYILFKEFILSML